MKNMDENKIDRFKEEEKLYFVNMIKIKIGKQDSFQRKWEKEKRVGKKSC